MITLENVLVPADLGEASATVLTYGRHLARVFGATLHVLHVVDNVVSRVTSGVEGYVPDVSEVQRALEESARKQLDTIVTDEDRRELHANAILRTSATPALAIVAYAKDANIDLIVMGTHGRGAVAHFFMGSVAERVVRTAPCPVLTVRYTEQTFVVPDAR